MAIINLKVINDKQNLYKRRNAKYIFSDQMYCVNVQICSKQTTLAIN